MTARIGWQPDLRTAAVLIGALFLYVSILSLRAVPVLIDDLQGYCGGAGVGLACTVPAWVTNTAVIGLVSTAADLIVVTGAATLLLGVVRQGRLVTEAGLIGVAALQVAAAINMLAGNSLGGQPRISLDRASHRSGRTPAGRLRDATARSLNLSSPTFSADRSYRRYRTSTSSLIPVRSSPSIEMSMNDGMQTRSRPPAAT